MPKPIERLLAYFNFIGIFKERITYGGFTAMEANNQIGFDIVHE